eukprot:CAMPEP_0114647758 /NCGR_PEP_ID=MMETSP0191-20121206/5962_1 /TAXON_ID=126664 /ORGANISM="Sorites sp." /LENGTH=169 /DNA_ID=CAMNT_0001860889 /DNA_START=40 /DNA_END=550 /DNA_ORIENTATION=-
MSHGDLSPLAAAHARRPAPASLFPAAARTDGYDGSRASPLSRAHLHREEHAEHAASGPSTLESKGSAMLPGRALSPMSRAHGGDRRRSSDASSVFMHSSSDMSGLSGEGHMSPLSKSHSKTSHPAREKLPERHALGEPSPLSMAHSKDVRAEASSMKAEVMTLEVLRPV